MPQTKVAGDFILSIQKEISESVFFRSLLIKY